MRKAVIGELISFSVFIFYLIFARTLHSSFPQTDLFFKWALGLSAFSSFILFPAIMLLLFSDKHNPKEAPMKNQDYFKGTITREEYIRWKLFALFSYFTLAIAIYFSLKAQNFILLIILFFTFVVLAVTDQKKSSQRLHDLGVSENWYMLSGLPLIGSLIQLWLLLGGKAKKPNKYS